MLLGYTVAKAPASPRNLTWFTRPFILVRGWGLGTRLLPFPQTDPDVFITDSLEDDVRGELSAAILQKLGEVKQGPSIHEELSYHTPTEQTQNFILVHRLSGP